MDPVLRLVLLNEELRLEDIFEPSEPHNLPIPPIVPQTVQLGNNNDADFAMSLNEPTLSESSERPAIEMDQVQDEGRATGELQVVAAAGTNGQPTSSTSAPLTSTSMEPLRSPSPVTTQDILKIPTRYKMLHHKRKSVPEEMKDAKYYESRKKAAEMSRKAREKQKRIDAERMTLLNNTMKEIKQLKKKLAGFKQLKMKHSQLQRNHAWLYQIFLNLTRQSGHQNLTDDFNSN